MTFSLRFPAPRRPCRRRPSRRRPARLASRNRPTPSRSAISPARAAFRRTNWPSELGYFKDLGIELENVGYAQGGPASLFALAAGSVDLGSAATVGGHQLDRRRQRLRRRLSRRTASTTRSRASSTCWRTARSNRSPTSPASRSRSTRSAPISTTRCARRCTRRGLPQNAANLIVVPGPQLEQTLALRPGRHRRRSATGSRPSRAC